MSPADFSLTPWQSQSLSSLMFPYIFTAPTCVSWLHANFNGVYAQWLVGTPTLASVHDNVGHIS
jgi:hypothetical protein